MNKRIYIALCFVVSLCLSLDAQGKLLFKDDFESDTEGKAPSKWELSAGDSKGVVVKDPQ